MILSFEYDKNGEIRMNCDKEGAIKLTGYLTSLINGKDTHYHLMTPLWGGTELTEHCFNPSNQLVNQVTITILNEK